MTTEYVILDRAGRDVIRNPFEFRRLGMFDENGSRMSVQRTSGMTVKSTSLWTAPKSTSFRTAQGAK